MVRLDLSFLNTFAVDLDGQPITQFRSANNQGLLVYLALHSNKPQPRNVLATLFWPEETEKTARHNLRQALYHLRTLLADTKSNGDPFLKVNRQTAQFNPQSDYNLDVQQFLEAIDRNDLETAVSLYHGDLLPGFTCDSLQFEEWLRQEQERLHQLALEAMSKLTQNHLAVGSFEQAQAVAHRQLALEPWSESACRQLMKAYALAGDRGNALAAYGKCREALWESLGVEPVEETTVLFEEIEAGQFSAAQSDKAQQPLDAVQHNLPGQTTPFIGRQHELEEIPRLLLETDCRLLTLVGLGGMGKTRTAIEAAQAIAADGGGLFADGVRFVTFAPVDDLTSALRALADALQYQLTGGDVPQDKQLLTVLSMKKMLLVMDNLEHLLGQGIGRFVEDILSVAPGVRLLVTSRERVNLRAESVLNLSGMDNESPYLTNGKTISLKDAADSVRLFVQGAHRSLPDFALNSETISDVAGICHLCGGMPLAIELASGWLGVLSPKEIAAELSRSLDILSTTMRDVPQRQRSLRAVFEASWQRLSAQEQQAFLRLSVFRGGFQRAQGEAATGISLPLLLSLVNRSFLQREANGRLGLHEQLRLFANERLQQDKQAWREAKEAHSRAYSTFMAEQLPRLRGKEQWTALEEIERELDNIRVAWEWLVAQGELETAVTKMLPGLHRFAFVRMRQADVEPLVQAALNKVRPVDRGEYSVAYLILQTAVIDLSFQQMYHPPFFYPNGKELLRELWPAAIASRREMGEWFYRFLQLHVINVGEDKAFREWEIHNETLRLQNDRWQLASSLRRFAAMLRFTDRDRARPFGILQETLQLFEELGDEFEIARTLFEFCWMSSWAEDYTGAIEHGQQAQQLLAGKGAAVFRGRIIHEIFDAYLRMGRYDEAFAYLAEEQAIYRRINRLDRLKISVGWESMEAGRFSSLEHAFEKRQESMALGRTIARTQGQAEGKLLDYDYFELGELYRITGDLKQARNCYDLAGALFRSNNNEHGESYYQRALGDLAFAEKRFGQAEPYFRSYLETARAISFLWDVGMALIKLSRALRGIGRYEESEERLREAIAQLDIPAVVASLVWPVLALAELRAAQQRYHESALLAAFVLRQRLSWLEMRNLAEDVLQEIKPNLEPDFDVSAAAKTAEETLIPDLIQTRLPPLE